MAPESLILSRGAESFLRPSHLRETSAQPSGTEVMRGGLAYSRFNHDLSWIPAQNLSSHPRALQPTGQSKTLALMSATKASGTMVMRQAAGKSGSEEEKEKYKDAAKKTGEAFLETDLGKKLAAQAKEKGEEFITSIPGMVITGAAAAGAVGYLAATNKELPIGLPAIPLDKLHPGLKMKITYEGPVLSPTKAMITFSGTFGSPKEGLKTGMTKTEMEKAKTAKMAAEIAAFQEMLKTPEQKKAEADVWAEFTADRWGPKFPVAKEGVPAVPSLTLTPPTLEYKKKSYKLLEEELKLDLPGIEIKHEEETEKKNKEEEEPLQRKAQNGTKGETAARDVPPIVHDVLRSPGRPLDPEIRKFFEPRFGYDFSRVRVHTDARAAESARAMSALAYTVGENLVFDNGWYSSSTFAARKLIAHELAHTIQQSNAGSVQEIAVDSDGDSLERAADRAADLALSIHANNPPAGDKTGSPAIPAVQLLDASMAYPAIQCTPRPACRHDRLTRNQYLRGISWLEEQGHITTEEAQNLREHIPQSRRARCRMIEDLQRRARRGRAGIVQSRRGQSSAHLISNFQVTPRTIRVDEGEAARISFDVTASDVASINVMIIKYEFSSELPDYREFNFSRSLSPGHKVAVWDGTFMGSRNQPVEAGTYRVRVWVSDRAGRREEAFEQIRVVNPTGATVLPRTESGLALRSLEFNGREAVLTDAGGHAIRARAVSGLRPNNPHNRRHLDYTDPQYQCVPNRGPIPAGRYFIDSHAAQQPDLVRGRLRYPSGGRASAWGPFRAPLRPADPTAVCGRSGFFFHLDVTDDGTAGCIGIARGDEANFNQMVALMLRIPSGSSLPVHVRYQS